MKPPTKSLIISSCQNGWIFAPFPPVDGHLGEWPDRKEKFVYTELAHLLAEIPQLLGVEPDVIECCPEDVRGPTL